MVGTVLVEIEDAHFLWMLGEGSAPTALRLPPGGVDTPETLRLLRRMTKRLHAMGSRGSWVIARDGDVVGLCSYKQPPKDGVVEIGYGVAESRRRLGHATRAVAEMLSFARDDPAVNAVVASTARDNVASQRALERNGFVQDGATFDPDDGELLLWRRDLS